MWTCAYQPLAFPFDLYVAEDWIELRSDPIRLIFREDNDAVDATRLEGLHDVRHIVLLVAICSDGTCPDLTVGGDIDTAITCEHAGD